MLFCIIRPENKDSLKYWIALPLCLYFAGITMVWLEREGAVFIPVELIGI